MTISSTGERVDVCDMVRYAGQEWVVVGMRGEVLRLQRAGHLGPVRISGVLASEVTITRLTSRSPLSRRRAALAGTGNGTGGRA